MNPGIGTGLTELNLVQVESDNSILAAGPVGETGHLSFGVIHLTASGTLDTTFGNQGEADVVLPTGLPSGFSVGSKPSALLIQSDGKILVVGTASALSADFSVVARFDANGQPDPTFGTNGVEVVDLATLGLTNGSLTDAALQTNGEIVLVGSSTFEFNGGNKDQIAAIELQTNGTINTSFGTGGVVTISDLTANEEGAAGNESTDGVTVQANGQIVILAKVVYGLETPQISIPELIRLNANGSRDSTISQAGLESANLLYPEQILEQPNGQFLVLGNTDGGDSIGVPMLGEGPVVARLNADGTLDATATLPPAQMGKLLGLPSAEDSLTQIALQPNGDVALLGSGFLPAKGEIQNIRLTPNLTPDVTYGTDGVSTVSINLPDQILVSANALAVGPNNQIVLAGDNATNSGSAMSIVVARLTASAPAVSGDYTGDGISDPAIYLPASGSFAIRPSSGGADQIIPFGLAGAGQTIPAPGDYDGSGVTEIGAYLPSLAIYAYRPANGGPDVLESFGIPGVGQSIPAPGDYLGTGQDDVAIYLPSTASFAIRNPAGGPDIIVPFGIAGPGQTIPAPGDYFGTGQDDIAAYLPSIGSFAIRNPLGGPDEIIPFGIPGLGQSIPIPGDYDNSGKTELAVYIPSLGLFAYRPANGGPDVLIPFGTPGDGSLPVPGDYDGSGKTEIAIDDPNYASFAYRPANGGADVLESFGIPGVGQSIPVASPSGALPEYNGVGPVESESESESAEAATSSPSAKSALRTLKSAVATTGKAVPSGPSLGSSRVALKPVNQGDSNPLKSTG